MLRSLRPRIGSAALFLLALVLLSCNPTRRLQPLPEDNRPAHISFLSNPEGATVRVNGKLLDGKTPLEYQEVPAGVNVIEFEKEGYRSLVTQQYWKPNALTRLDVTLESLATQTPTPTPTETPTRTSPPLPPATAPTRAPSDAPTPVPTRSAATAAAPPTAVPKAATARVSLLSTPPGATIIVNGEQLEGVAPRKNIALPAGPASVEFRLANYEPMRITRNWQPGGKDTVAVELVPLPARLSVHTTPSGATVKVNGVTVEGQTPIDNALVPAGETQIIIELENHLPHMERKPLAANGEARIDAELKPMDTVVRFESDPPGATVIVNNRPLRPKTPAGPMPMPPGHVRIEFQLEGHEPRTIERDWAPAGLDSVMAKLAPKPGRAQFESSGAWDTLAVDGKVVAVNPGGWLPLPAGEHKVLAQRGGRAAETRFVVPPGGDTVVSLNWSNVRPSMSDFVELPAVSATLGDKRFTDTNPARTVDVAAFWMGRREVTVDEYRACVHATRCAAPGTDAGCNWGAADRGKHPINCVSAKDAETYAAWAAERAGIPYRLPTADEWERAARGGGDRAYPWGDEPPGARCNTCDRSCPVERFRDDSINDGRPETAPVGAMAYCASKEGVVDLVGNVAEWTRVGATGETFQARGGSWAQNGLFLEPALPVTRAPGDRDPTIGFRLAASSDALPQAPPPSPTPADAPTPASAAEPPAPPATEALQAPAPTATEEVASEGNR